MLSKIIGKRSNTVSLSINDWLTFEIVTDKAGKSTGYLVARCHHKSAKPPIKAVQMKIHKAFPSPPLPPYEIWHEESKQLDDLLDLREDEIRSLSDYNDYIFEHKFKVIRLA